MKDQFLRTVDYMRISVTESCNLRCRYCMPKGVQKFSYHNNLTHDEILQICNCASVLGIRHIKITGGEPLLRKGVVKLIADIKKMNGIEHVTMTTNGVLLSEYMDELKKISIDCVNVSLDTLNPITYQMITGQDEFCKVWNGIMQLIESGIPTKINCVMQKGINENEWMNFVDIAVKMPVDVRFIEIMPIGYAKKFGLVSGAEIKTKIVQKYPYSFKLHRKRGFGPAEYITCEGWKGNVGFINAVSEKFCDICNRIRLMANGYLKPCLCYADGVDLKTALRSGVTDDGLIAMIAGAIKAKPYAHYFGCCDIENYEHREMYQIGG
jgi:cyclic pyranopterin phosphate synthase